MRAPVDHAIPLAVQLTKAYDSWSGFRREAEGEGAAHPGDRGLWPAALLFVSV